MILEQIAESSKKRVLDSMKQISLDEIKKQALALKNRDFRFEKALSGENLSFICEVKKASPSKGIISEDFPYVTIAEEYERAGAAAISVLTEPEFFLGSGQYLREISQAVRTPLLRKDFIVHEYQIYEAKTLGADAVLLICSLLDTERLRTFLAICDSLGLSALVEAHDEQEVASALKAGARMIGVNNRNLKTFEVNIETAIRLRSQAPPHLLFVAESGIRNSGDIRNLCRAGVNAVLVGETLMKTQDKKAALDGLREGCHEG